MKHLSKTIAFLSLSTALSSGMTMQNNDLDALMNQGPNGPNAQQAIQEIQAKGIMASQAEKDFVAQVQNLAQQAPSSVSSVQGKYGHILKQTQNRKK